MSALRKFPTKLKEIKYEIEGYAKEFGLDFFDVIFEVLDYKEMNEIAAYGGFPVRYPHWRFGMEYEQLSKRYVYGLQKVYEMVINNDPCYAYLLRSNNFVDQKLVMAHVYAHCDFFKNNLWFSKTNRKFLDEMANHATRIREYIDNHGLDVVEDFIDACLSLEGLIDYHSQFIKRAEEGKRDVFEDEEEEELVLHKLKTKSYMDAFVNPPEFIKEQKERIKAEKEKRAEKEKGTIIIDNERDILEFLIQNAPLENWQRNVLSIIREEAYYFAPQKQTKIMNEGWASYWHSKIMTEKALRDSEVIDFADHHAGGMGKRPGVINPYKVGMELFKDIEDRWNKGRFGEEYEECKDALEKKKWDKKLGLGRQKIFEVRRIYNDIDFIDEFLTEEFCREHELFVYEYTRAGDMYVISNRNFEDIKKKLLFQLTNFGKPIILLKDANHNNAGELFLEHQYSGVDMKMDYAKATLRNIHNIWKRPVHLETYENEKKITMSCLE